MPGVTAMLTRTLEPEVMETDDEAAEYDAMDHSVVNRAFVTDLLAALGPQHSPRCLRVLDAGTGTALIPIELVRTGIDVRVLAADAAQSMLQVARANVNAAGSADRIELAQRDCKQLSDADQTFDVVMSNSLVHHLPTPEDMLRECWRVLRSGGLLFVRDLARPSSLAEVEGLVQRYAAESSPTQQQLLRQSLEAALTVAEVQALLSALGIDPGCVALSSDRHWTIAALKP